MLPNRETRIRAYLGDMTVQAHGDAAIYDLMENGVLPLEPHFEQAAKELIYPLMHRVRWNVERIVNRLQQAGYLFVDTNYFVPPAGDVSTEIEAFEKATNQYVPLVFRAWVETVGRVCLMGTHPDWPEITFNGLGGTGNAICSDPLVMFWSPIHDLAAWKKSFLRTRSGIVKEPFVLEFAPDPGHKAAYSSSGSYNLPMTASPSIDVLVKDDDNSKYRRTFLEHIRDSFKLGGFPGWSDYKNAPAESLQELANGLEVV